MQKKKKKNRWWAGFVLQVIDQILELYSDICTFIQTVSTACVVLLPFFHPLTLFNSSSTEFCPSLLVDLLHMLTSSGSAFRQLEDLGQII